MILRRYVGFGLVRGWLLVFVVLATLFGLLFFIDELDHVDEGYNAFEVGMYILATLPQQMITLAPVIVLLGSIIALAHLDSSNELTVVICGGVSKGQLLSFVVLPTLAAMGVIWACMEYVTPMLQKNAEDFRLAHRYGEQVELPGGGVWSVSSNRYLHVREMRAGRRPGEIEIFQFDDNGRLSHVLFADSADVQSDGTWYMQQVTQKALNPVNTVDSATYGSLEVPGLLVPSELPNLSTSIASMSLSTLYRYSQYRSIGGLPGETYKREFWKRLMMPATVLSMALLAIPIAVSPGSNRGRSIGLRVSLGALVGILFYLGAQIVFSLGQLLALNPLLVAICPALIIAAVALIYLHRIRW